MFILIVLVHLVCRCCCSVVAMDTPIRQCQYYDRLFCDLHGNELLYHKPKGEVTGQTAGYDAAPAGSVDMSKVS